MRFQFVCTQCPMCGTAESLLRYRITKFQQGELCFVTCQLCGTVYQNPMPNQASMRAFYHSQQFFNAKATSEPLTGYRDYDGEEKTRQINAQRRLSEVEKLFAVDRPLRILKVACGYGTLVKLARDRGHDAHGIDFSENMIVGAKRRYGIDLIHADFLQHDFGETRYNAVLLFGAINNFLRPLEVARKAFSLLTPGGFYVVNHVWLNSFPEKLLGGRYWIYRPPIIGLYPRNVFERFHVQLGYELYRSQYDVQYLTLDKLFGYLQFEPLIRFVELSQLARVGFTIPIPGYARVFFRKP